MWRGKGAIGARDIKTPSAAALMGGCCGKMRQIDIPVFRDPLGNPETVTLSIVLVDVEGQPAVAYTAAGGIVGRVDIAVTGLISISLHTRDELRAPGSGPLAYRVTLTRAGASDTRLCRLDPGAELQFGDWWLSGQ